MSVSLITGMTGTPHVTSAQDGRKNAFAFGSGRYVFDSGSKFAYELISNNLIKISDGDLIDQGRHICTEQNDYTELTIDNGISGNNRKDLIVMRYEKDVNTSIETASLVVIKGTSTSGTASDPEYTAGDILAGELVDEFPLYRVNIEGLSVASIDTMFDVLPVGGINGILASLAAEAKNREDTDKDLQEQIDGVNTNLGYSKTPVKNAITVQNGTLIDAYTENGCVFIRHLLPTGVTGGTLELFTIETKYAPRITISGTTQITGSGSDAGKVMGSQIDNSGKCTVWINKELTNSVYVSFCYPLRTT